MRHLVKYVGIIKLQHSSETRVNIHGPTFYYKSNQIYEQLPKVRTEIGQGMQWDANDANRSTTLQTQ